MAFTVEQTHGILWRPENSIRASSDRHRWTSVYASAQLELPYEGNFRAVQDQLMVLHLDGPVEIDRSPRRSPIRHRVPAGGIHLVPPGMEFGVRLMGVLNTLHVYLRRSVIEEVAAEITVGDPRAIEIPPSIIDCDPSLRSLLDVVETALEDDDPATSLCIDHLSRAIAARLIRAHSTSTARAYQPLNPVMRPSPIIARAIDYMRAHLDEPLHLECIAAAVARSPSHLARQFRSELGVPPHQYLVNLRLETAQHMLAQTKLPIASIAVSCGFSHQEHLTRFFKRRCATTPAAFRRARCN